MATSAGRPRDLVRREVDREEEALVSLLRAMRGSTATVDRQVVREAIRRLESGACRCGTTYDRTEAERAPE